MYKIVLAAATMLAMSAAAAPTEAAIVTYAVSGSFADGRALKGSFGVDDNGTGTFNQIKNINLSVDGLGPFSNVGGASFSGPSMTTDFYQIYFYDDKTFSIMLGIGFIAKHENFKILSIANQAIKMGTFYSGPSGISSELVSGAISSNSVTAVPEPAAWAMMLVGLGMIGAATRYRRRSVNATYA